MKYKFYYVGERLAIVHCMQIRVRDMHCLHVYIYLVLYYVNEYLR